jgi:RNA polymerase sigma factor FliA
VTAREPIPLRPRTAGADDADVLERFHSSLELVDMIAGQLQRSLGRAAEHDELVANGREGLLDAARRYDASRGVPFRLYANYRVRGAMLDGVRKSATLPRRTYEKLVALRAASSVGEGELEYAVRAAPPAADLAKTERLLAEQLSSMAMGAALAMLSEQTAGEASEAADDPDANPEEALARAQIASKVRRALDDLSPEAAAVVRRHYLEGERLEDIARDYEMSKSWASRLLTRTTAVLAKRLSALAPA